MNRNTTVAALASAAFIGLSAGIATTRTGADVDPAVIHRRLLGEQPVVLASWQPAEPAYGELVPCCATPAPAPVAETARSSTPTGPTLAVAMGRLADTSLARELPEAFAAYAAATSSQFSTTSDRQAIEQVAHAQCDVALVGTNLTERDRLAGLEATEVGLELFAVVVPASSPVRSLTARQVRAVLAGETRVWSDLGYDLGPIRLVAPQESGLRERAARALCRGDNLDAMAEVTTSDATTAERVGSSSNGVGVVRMRDEPLDSKSRYLQIDWTEPGADQFASGRYPFGARLLMVTQGAPQAGALTLGTFLRSKSGREVLSRHLLAR